MKLQVEYVPIGTIKPYKRNAKLHPQEQIEQIKNSMKEFMIELKSFCRAKETISKVKRQPSEWEKIIAKETTGRGLISKYTSSSYNSIPEKQTTQSKSGEKT